MVALLPVVRRSCRCPPHPLRHFAPATSTWWAGTQRGNTRVSARQLYINTLLENAWISLLFFKNLFFCGFSPRRCVWEISIQFHHRVSIISGAFSTRLGIATAWIIILLLPPLCQRFSNLMLVAPTVASCGSILCRSQGCGTAICETANEFNSR